MMDRGRERTVDAPEFCSWAISTNHEVPPWAISTISTTMRCLKGYRIHNFLKNPLDPGRLSHVLSSHCSIHLAVLSVSLQPPLPMCESAVIPRNYVWTLSEISKFLSPHGAFASDWECPWSCRVHEPSLRFWFCHHTP